MSFTGRPSQAVDITVANNGFFPDLALVDLQTLYRVPAELAPKTVEHQVRIALSSVNKQLIDEQAAWQAEGFETLAAVDREKDSERCAEYFAAVFLKAKAALLTDFQTFTRRASAEEMARESDAIRQRLLADSGRAVRQLKGLTTTIGVELL